MKRILLLVTAFILFSVPGFSQFGVKGGLNFNSFDDVKINKETDFKTVFERKTGYHVGILYKTKIPLIGLAIQPELLYSQTNSSLTFTGENPASSYYDPATGKTLSTVTGDMNISYLQLPVSVQWGIDLMLFRPFIQVVPYIGCVINSNLGIDNINLKLNADKFNYGIGVGAGLDIWKLQVSGRYNWDLGNVANFEWKGIDTFKGGKNKGFELSLAILF